MSVDDLVGFGLFVEAVTFPDVPMPRAVDAIIAAAEAGNLNLSAIVPVSMSPDPLATMKALQAALPTLPHDNNQLTAYIAAPIITLLTVVTTGLRLWGRRRISGELKKGDWCALVAAVSSNQ